MSLTAPVDEGQENPALVEVMLRRRKSAPALYWRLRRPKTRVYVGAVTRLVIYRLAAAAAAVLAITLLAFVGAVAGNIGYPRWPALKSIGAETIKVAAVHAMAEPSHWAPAFIAFGLVLVIIPRPHRWLFRITMAGGVALGYYQRRIPPFPPSTVSADITSRTASLISQAIRLVSKTTVPVAPPSQLAAALATAVGSLALVALIGYVLYRNAYTLTARTTGFIPHRPVKHYRSMFCAVSVTKRLTAVPITAGLLTVDFWIAENIRVLLPVDSWIVEKIRVLLPATRYRAFLFAHSPLSPAQWVLAAAAVALIICAPRPRGYPWLLIVLLVAMTAYALVPYQSLFPVPTGFLAAPDSFWALAIGYLLMTGLAFDIVAALLDWPI